MKRITITFSLLACVFGVAALGCQTASSNVAADKPAEKTVKANNATPPAAATPADDAPRINLADAKAAFDAGQAVFIDTRAASAYDAEHIKGALNIPKDKLAEKINDIPKGKKIIAYCS